MKASNIITIASLFVCMACANELPGDTTDGQGGKEEPIHLSFQLYTPTTKALGATATEDMADNTEFRIYAYEKGAAVQSSSPKGSATYKVSGGSATGDLSLFRGEYDLYMISNNTNNAPEATDGTLTVDNGFDFMHNKIKGQIVKPDQEGGKAMNIPLTGPFVRTGTMLDLAVKINPDSPVTVKNLTIDSIKILNLCKPLTYVLGADALSGTSSYDATTKVTGFTETSEEYGKSVVVLPTEGTSELEFDIFLNITYQEGKEDITGTYSYTVNLSKALLKGMRYKLTFNLTFFGKLTFGDISLTLKEYTENKQDINDVGE